MRTSGIAIAVSMALVGLSLANDASAVIGKTISIPEQQLSSALRALAKERRFHVLFRSDVVRDVRTAGAVGDFTNDEALEQLLSGTAFTFQYLDERTVTIVPLHVVGTAAGATLRTSDDYHGVGARSAEGDQEPRVDSAVGPHANTSSSKKSELEEIVVTGSHIRGTDKSAAPVSIISRKDIEHSGYTTVQDILKTFTPNTGGGPSEELQPGLETASNYNAGGSINLRGLGASSTLVLVDGRRQAGGGVDGRFVDVSSIPSSAIERIEILTDGASAIYGADAVGGVVNVILRRDFDGAETRLRVGSARDGAAETVVAQLVGASWDTGHAMFGYQFLERESLDFADRAFAANSDKRPLGGSNFSLPFSNPGNILNPTTGTLAFGIPRGQDGRSLTPADLVPGLVNYRSTWEGAVLLPSQRTNSAVFAASQRLGERLELHADGRFSDRDMTRRNGGTPGLLIVPSSNPFFVDPFGGSTSVRVYYSMIDDLGPRPVQGETKTYSGSLGGTLTLNDGWELDAFGSYGKEQLRYQTGNLISSRDLAAALADTNPDTAFNPFGHGSNTNQATLDSIRLSQSELADAETWSASAILQGPAFALPGSSLAKIAVGGDFRAENLERLSRLTSRSTNTASIHRPIERRVTAGFLELQLPFVGTENRLPGVESLNLSLAGRYENYSDFGSTFNPKLGITWSPTSSLNVRATAGASFRAPNLMDMDVNSTITPSRASLQLVNDPQSPTGRSRILALYGNNANLKEETAKTWTFGIDVRPESIPELNASFTYYKIDYKDRIEQGGPGNISDIYSEEARWAPIITRTPSRETVDAICNSPQFTGLRSDCLTGPLPAIVDNRVRNLGVAKVDGIDAKVSYEMPTRRGDLRLRLDGTYILTFDQATTSTTPLIDLVDTLNGPLSLRVRLDVSWEYRGASVGAAVNYQNSYTNHRSTPRSDIDAFTTLDLRAAYDFEARRNWLRGTQLALSVTNALDEPPPFVNSLYGYDQSNADPIGRVISLQLAKTW